MLTRRRPAVGFRGTWFWLYVRAAFDSFMPILASLQLVEHLRQRGLHLQRLLDLVGGEEGVLAVLHEARALVRPDERDEGRGVRLPVHGEALEVLEHRVEAALAEDGDRVLGVLVEVGV